MHVLVIGGAGYIGSHVSLELLDAGHDVTVFDNLSSGSRDNVFKAERFIEGDILDAGALDRAMSTGIDAVVHLAAFKAAGESMLLPEKYARNNINGTVNIINAMSSAAVRHLVFSSSAAVYGEPAYLPIDENHPLQPENFYGFTKLEVERILSWYDRLKGLRYAALRYFNAAGYDIRGRVHGLERNPANLLPVVMEVAAGLRDRLQVFGNDYATIDGTGVRDYVHVGDLARAHLAALDYLVREDRSLVVNLGSEAGLSVMDIVKAARDITGQAIPLTVTGRRPGDPARLIASSGLAKTVLNWEARYSDAATLVRTSWDVYRGCKRG
jgi:UDP-glucose 4-epimerase